MLFLEFRDLTITHHPSTKGVRPGLLRTALFPALSMTHIICSVQSQQVYSEPPKKCTQRSRTLVYVHTVLTGALTHPKSCQEYSSKAEEQTGMTDLKQESQGEEEEAFIHSPPPPPSCQA